MRIAWFLNEKLYQNYDMKVEYVNVDHINDAWNSGHENVHRCEPLESWLRAGLGDKRHYFSSISINYVGN